MRDNIGNASMELQWDEHVHTESVRLASRNASPRRGAGQEHQPEIAELDLVAVGQDGRVHRLTIDIRSVEAASVDYAEFAIFTPEFGMARG